MICSTFNQFALSGIMNLYDGKLDNISYFGMTGLYLAVTTLGLLLLLVYSNLVIGEPRVSSIHLE